MSGFRVRFAAAAIALAVVYPASLAAQEGLRDRDPQLEAARRITEDLRRATLHSGPFYLLSSLNISDIGVEQRFYVPTNEQASGIAFSIGAPQRLYIVARKKLIFSADVAPTWAFGLQRKDQNGEKVPNEKKRNQFGYRLRADTQLLLNHLYLDAYGQQSDDLYADSAEINRILTLKNQEFGAVGEAKYSSRTSSSFAAIHRKIDHPTDRFQPFNVPIQLLDRSENDYRASILHKTFPLTGLFVSGEMSDYRFRTATRKDSRRIFTGGGFLFDNGRAVLRVEAGNGRLRFDDPNGHDYSGLLGNLRFSRRVAAHSSITIEVARDLEFSIFANNDYFLFDRGSLATEWDANRRLTLRAGAQVGRNLYQVPVGGVLRRDTYTYPWVGFLWTIRRLRVGADVGYYQRTSNLISAEEADGIRVVLRLSLTP